MAVMAESTKLEDFRTGKLPKSCRYFKMKKIGDLKARTADKLIRDFIDKKAVIQSDDSKTYSQF